MSNVDVIFPLWGREWNFITGYSLQWWKNLNIILQEKCSWMYPAQYIDRNDEFSVIQRIFEIHTFTIESVMME